MLSYVKESKTATADQVERGIFKRLLELGFRLMLLFFTLRAEAYCIIRPMPTIDSDGCRPPIPGHADHLFRQQGVQFFRNTGIGGRLSLESVDGMLQNPG
jgi:hypothetical protein